jgi:hypothetical protein
MNAYEYFIVSIFVTNIDFWTLSSVMFLFKNDISETGTSCIDWAQLSRLFPEDGDSPVFETSF